jgi:hypothetical protein
MNNFLLAVDACSSRTARAPYRPARASPTSASPPPKHGRILSGWSAIGERLRTKPDQICKKVIYGLMGIAAITRDKPARVLR